MEHLHNYNDNFYYHLEDYEEDSDPHPEQEGAAEEGGRVYEGALSLDDSENQQGNLNQGGHMSPYNSLGPEGDHSSQVPKEADPEEPAMVYWEAFHNDPGDKEKRKDSCSCFLVTIPSKETREGYCHSFNRMLSPGADEHQEQEHGGNTVVLKAGEEGGKKGLVQSELAQGELGQGELALGEIAPSKPAQEELAQSGLTQEATGVVEEGENEEEEMEGGQAGDGSSDPMDQGIPAEGGHGSSIEQQPQQEAAMPEGTKSLQAGDRQPFQRRTRFTQSQLRDLERLFKENRYPSFQVRKDLARWMGVPEADVLDWFRTRRVNFK
ncbi:rhox homeobox family member 2-like [Peromyscus californicus insignis]|uniref:rhox homeobox family member 2-like n=1 Tax=Peromyscus californicus insignis TaxID=564181 RepID=UPI0022A77991|nr:rhox homeobox family member 2-like [Peromyscus californicus insignis]